MNIALKFPELQFFGTKASCLSPRSWPRAPRAEADNRRSTATISGVTKPMASAGFGGLGSI
jgi:hypothetical protein